MVAEYIPRKRHADALQAFARLENRQVHLVLAGSGFLEEQMKGLAASLGIADRLHFLGFRRDVRAYVRSAYATVLPSSQEGLPRCIMESLAFGVPAIGTDVRGTRDLIHGGAGLLVTLGDIPGLAQAMDWLLAHPAEARHMGETGKQQMAAYELNAIIQHHELLYAQALQEVELTLPYTLPVAVESWTPAER
jgi:glycosyltransferase involved in cell wall biosynthesis